MDIYIYIERERENQPKFISSVDGFCPFHILHNFWVFEKKKRHPSISGLPRLGNDVSALGSGQCLMPQQFKVESWKERHKWYKYHAQIVRFVVDIWVIFCVDIRWMSHVSLYRVFRIPTGEGFGPSTHISYEWVLKKEETSYTVFEPQKKWNAKTTHIMIIQWVLPKHWFIVDHEA